MDQLQYPFCGLDNMKSRKEQLHFVTSHSGGPLQKNSGVPFLMNPIMLMLTIPVYLSHHQKPKPFWSHIILRHLGAQGSVCLLSELRFWGHNLLRGFLCVIWSWPQALDSMCVCVLSRFSHVWLFVTLWTVSPRGSSIEGILQKIILQWIAMPSSRGSSSPRDQTHVS